MASPYSHRAGNRKALMGLQVSSKAVSPMRNVLNALLLGTILVFPAFSVCARDEQAAAPAQEPQEKKADAAPKGIAPRASAARYTAHAELEGIAIGAALLTPEEVRRAFTTDLNRCCAVVEVALFPEKGKAAEIAREDFTLRVVGTEIAAKPSGPQLLALTLQLAAPGERDAGLHGSVGAGVTYGLGGYDPATGQRRGRGVDTSADVAVGGGGPPPEPGSEPQGGSGTKLTANDREFMGLELTAKGLPEGTLSAPVAGYLYFPVTKKKNKKAVRQLDYTLAGHKVVLTLP